jgi:hypothetical protein
VPRRPKEGDHLILLLLQPVDQVVRTRRTRQQACASHERKLPAAEQVALDRMDQDAMLALLVEAFLVEDSIKPKGVPAGVTKINQTLEPIWLGGWNCHDVLF